MAPDKLPLNQLHSFAAAFARVALSRPHNPAIVTEAGTVGYGQLLMGSIAVARRLRGLGVDRRSTIALNTGDPVISVACLIASSLLGCRLVTAGAILSKHKVIRPTHFLRTLDAKGKEGAGFIEIDQSWFGEDVSPSDDEAAFEGYGDADDPWLILHTSGTTGRPKFMALSHRIVADRTRAIAEDFPTGRVTCVLLFKPTSRPYFARAIGALQNGCTIVDSVDTAFWKNSGVTTVFCSPSQFETFRTRYGIAHRFRKVEISGARLEDDMVRVLARNFDEIVDIYGASETNKSFANLVSLGADGTIKRKGRRLDSSVEIVDASGRPVVPGETGTVRVRNGYMVSGYINDPEATETNFREGWFLPGDLARWGPEGALDVVGRDDELFSFGGIKLDARLIDEIMRSVAGVEDAICVKSPKKHRNEVIGFVVFAEGANKAICESNIRKAYRDHTGLPAFLGRIHEIDRIPYTDEGRPMRETCRRLIMARLQNKSSKPGEDALA